MKAKTQAGIEYRDLNKNGRMDPYEDSSRTADIELTVTLGVHGPKNLDVWMMGK